MTKVRRLEPRLIKYLTEYNTLSVLVLYECCAA